MFRKLISMLLVAGLLAGLCVLPVSAADGHTDHCVCGGAAVGLYDHVCADVQWQPLPEGTTDFGKLPSGNYYLTGDVTVTAATNIAAGKQLSICLNGHNISSTSTRVFGYPLQGTVLNICDCSAEKGAEGWTFGGTVTAGAGSGKYGCVLYTMSESQANIFGGNFTGLSTNAANGSVFLAANDSCKDFDGDGKVTDTDKAYAEAASTLSIYNGNIYGSVTATGNGGVIGSFHNPKIHIHGGVISGGVSKSGGGNIYSSGALLVTGGTITGGSAATVGGNIRYKGTATITGGTISNGVATNNGGNIYSPGTLTVSGGTVTGGETKNYQGGNIYASDGSVTVTGGTITGGNSATMGGGIYVTNTVTTNISGNPVIDGNARGNLYMARNCPATIGQLTEGAKVGVLYADTWHKVTVTHSPTADVTNYIYSDSPEAYFTFSGTTMKQTAKSEEYTAAIKEQEYFDNTVEEALPMTVIYKLVDDHFAAELPAGKTEKKAIIIGYDAVRTDALKNVEDQDSAVLAVGADGGLYHAFAGGEYGGATQQMTVTSVGWTSMFTGFFARTHGVTANYSSAINAGVHTIFTKIAEQGKDVLLIGPGLGKQKNADGAYEEFFPEHWVAEIAYQETNDLPVTYYQPEENEAEALVSIIGQTDMPDLTWLYMGEPDVQGHAMSWGNHVPEYVKAVQDTDALGYSVYEAIKARSTYEQEDWLVIVTTDHGGYLTQHGEHSAQERSTWIAVNKPIDYTDEDYSAYDRINNETVNHSHCACGLGQAEHECEIENWMPWYDGDNLPTTSGNYYLMTDVDLSKMTGKIDLAIGVRQRLCLNGHTITGPESDISLWWVRNYLSLCDCVGTGKINLSSNLAGPLLHVFSSGTVSEGLGGTFELFGGTVTSTGKATNAGGGIVFVGNSGENKAVFNMYGGILQGGNTVKDGGAVNVSVKNAVFNMYGGTIRNSSADGYGGAVYVGSTTRQFNMYGGTIENSVATKGGGNIYCNGQFNMYGGTISGGIAAEGGNVMVDSSSVMNQYGGTIEKGGYKDTTITANKGGNMMLFGTWNLYGGTIKDGKSVNNGGNICTYNANGFVIQKTAESITDPLIQNGQSKYGGNIYYGGGNQKPAYYIYDGATIIGGTTTSGGEGGNIWVATKYTVNMYGGTVKDGGHKTNTNMGGNVFLYGKFNMYGGTIKDGKAKSQGGNISGWNSYQITMAKSDLSTTVPTISDGYSGANGGNVVLRGTAPVLNMSYGIITGGTSGLYVDKGTLNLSGTAQVTGNTKYNICLKSGMTLNATDLKEGAAFGVTLGSTTGKFTESTAEEFFFSDNADLLLVKKTDGLYLATAVAKAGETRYATVQEAAANDHVILLTDVTENVELSKDLYLDLNGKTLTGNIIGTGTLYGMDSATDDYTAGGRITGSISCNVENHFKDAETLKRYMAIADETGYTFNRFYIGITHLNLKPSADGVGYKATIAGNDAVLSKIAGYGYKLWLTEDKVLTASKDGAQLENVNTVTARVQNYDVAAYGEAPVNGSVFITLQDGTVIESSATTFTLRAILETISANAETYSDTQLSAVKDMVVRFSDAMADWSIDALR